jgi:hypothetical protein
MNKVKFYWQTISTSIVFQLRHKWAWYGLDWLDKILLRLYKIDYKEWTGETNQKGVEESERRT